MLNLIALFIALVAATPPCDYLIETPPTGASIVRDGETLFIENALLRRTIRLSPNAATVSLESFGNDRGLIRSVRPEARVSIDGTWYDVGGLHGQPNHAWLSPQWLDGMTADEDAFAFRTLDIAPITERLAWNRVRHHAPDAVWPPAGKHVAMQYDHRGLPGITVTVHYNVYDHIPVLSKWMTIRNDTAEAVTVDAFESEILAVVEQTSWVSTADNMPVPTDLHVETDFSFGAFVPEIANEHVVHWRTDPLYATQVNYQRQTPCLLVVAPTCGPSIDVAAGETFETYRTFELLHDSDDRERCGLARRRMYRTIAPWVTENPIMHHMRTSDPDAVRRAIDDAADVGFEMIILSFGSGFNIEDRRRETIEQWREIAAYAQQRGVEIGGYSLFSSRRIGNGNDIVSPEGTRPTHGNCPAVTSAWGQRYLQTLYEFYDKTGFTLLEHDGPYPGDVDVTARPPLQKGILDSRWVQWRLMTDFYRWCRARGVYINAPDRYMLNGTSKCGMGYRETNWSLPRAQQVIHTRQNIYDGTWTSTPSMGWMFVPLTEYHGGGAAATIEPLDEHRDHYARMLQSNFALGVQACYRGPRLFDTDATRALVKSQVDWFRKWRTILESDVIHGRRADGRRLDWMMHVNPSLETPGMLCVFNPLDEPRTETLVIDLYYTGVRERAVIAMEDTNPQVLEMDTATRITLDVTVHAGAMRWATIRRDDQ